MLRKKTKDYPNISLKAEDITAPVDLSQIFPRSASLHIEIGSGKGTFLLNQAKAQPEVNFLGIEWANKYYRHAVDRLGRWAINNVRVIRTDAAQFISEFISAESVGCFHIYFPDPWHKKRHHKRRFICAENTAQLLRCLTPDGIINIATDHADYFSQIQEVLESFNNRIELIDFIRPEGAEPGENAGTNFERKYLKEGRGIYTIAAKKN